MSLPANPWGIIFRNLFAPVGAMISALFAGDACGDFRLGSIEEWASMAFLVLFVWLFYAEIKEKRERINWFTVYYPDIEKTKYSIWSDGWLKFWIVVTLIVFVLGFYTRYLTLAC